MTATAAYAPVADLEEIDAGWMETTLRRAGALARGEVVGLDREPCGTGQLADCYRFTPRYSAEGAGPSTIVGKLHSADRSSRQFGAEYGFYRCEVRFYERLAPTLGVAVPRLLHAAVAPDGERFTLLLEDMAPCRSIDQLQGCGADEAALAVEQAAALHSGSWGRTGIDADSLSGVVDAYLQATDGFAGILTAFREQYGDAVAAADLAEAEKLTGLIEPWKRILTERRCLWHSDFRLDNMLFDAAGGVPLVVLDWQTLGLGPGMIDLAYFLGGSLTPATRRAHERDLVDHYHQALRAGGVEGYSRERCWEDYRLLSIFGLQTGVFGAVRVKRTERGDEMWRTWVERHAAQVRDHDSFTLLARRADR